MAAKAKKQLKPSTAKGGPGAITVTLKLTKAAKAKLAQAGKLKLRAAISFTPTGGGARLQEGKAQTEGKAVARKKTDARLAARGSGADQPADRAHQLLHLLLGGALAGAHAVADVVVEEAEGDLVEGGLGGLDLGEDVDAVAVLLHHPRDAADLALDAGEPLQQLLLRCLVSGCLGGSSLSASIPPWGIVVNRAMSDVSRHDRRGARAVLPDGLRGLVGAGPRVRDLGDRPGLGAARADRVGARRQRLRPVAKATGLGAASSSCSYAAIAIAKSLFQKGASAATALAFQFASTNLVWELGLVLWVLIGWQFTLAEYVGGIVMIVADGGAAAARSSRRGSRSRPASTPRRPRPGTSTTSAGERMSWRERLTSGEAWTDVADNFRGDWQMLWKEITIGFLLAGFIGLLGDDFFNVLFVTDAPAAVRTIENVIAGPIIAVLSFVCSIGNVPLAAVLWSGGISFAGVMAFIFADLIVLPIVAAYRKYYGVAFALRITALMFVTMVVAALIVDGLFSAVGLIPDTAPDARRTSSARSSSTTSWS